jgi:hypothetical protein
VGSAAAPGAVGTVQMMNPWSKRPGVRIGRRERTGVDRETVVSNGCDAAIAWPRPRSPAGAPAAPRRFCV